MTQRPKTEAEQVAFFERAHERFRSAVAARGEIHRDYRVAGTVVRLSFAGEALVPWLTRAIDHLRIEPVATPDVTFCLWDSASTGVTMIPPPCDREAFSDRGDLWGFHSHRIKTAFHYHDYSVNLFDHDRNTGIYWVNDARRLPYWVLASPLRTLFHWWMERHGCQLVHGAAVGVGDHALLAVGKGGLGKSSTALACLEAGFRFMGDDYVIVRRDPAPAVFCLYATAKINREDVARWPALHPHMNRVDVPPDEKAVLFLHPAFDAQLTTEMPLRAIAVPRVVDREETGFVPEAESLVREAASFTTMSQLPYAGDHTLRLFTRLCESLPGYRMELGRDRARLTAAVHAFLAEGTGPARTQAAPESTPLVSVIIPVLNGERFIADAVHSVLAQNYPALEIIIIDDGSTDGTEAAVRRLPCEVHYFKQARQGPAAARNRGIRDASGDLVAFLDVDDLWPAHTLHRLVAELRADPALEVARGYSQVMELDAALGRYEYRGNPKESFPYSITAGVYRKRVFDRVGLFDHNLLFGEDTDWYNRANELKIPIRRIEAVTLHVRRHGGNMTEGKSLVELNMLRVLKKSIDRQRSAAPPS